jgi:hypothetical protein
MDANEKDRIAKPVAYKIELGLWPHWDKILEKLAEQNGQKPDDFLEEIGKELGFEKGVFPKKPDGDLYTGLFKEHFYFKIYRDELSGMKMVWSHHHKSLVDSPTIFGNIFEPCSRLIYSKKYASHYVTRALKFGPEGARFDRFYDPFLFSPIKNDVFEDGKVAYIPFYDIIQLLLELGKGFDAAGFAIKQFPEELKQRLEKNNIEYNNQALSFLDGGIRKGDVEFDRSEHDRNNEEWFKNRGVKLYKQILDVNNAHTLDDSHVFHAPYYSVSINLEIFKTGNDYCWMTE